MSTITHRSVNPNHYHISNLDEVLSPSPVVFKDMLEANLHEMLQIAGSADRLRPHCKTHKMSSVIDMKKKLGINKFKCATIAEAEMLAGCDAENVLIAYQLVGPNVKRLIQLMDKFPATRFATLIDDFQALDALSGKLESADKQLDVFIDVDPGMGRTGIQPGEAAMHLYEAMVASPLVNAAGVHWYDGHIRQTDLNQRRLAVDAEYQQLSRFRNQLLMSGFDIPELIVSGTGAFPIWAEYHEPDMTLSPGTTVFFDAGYLEIFPDMKFQPALGVLTRVVSNHRPGHLTLDLGHKSIAADQPAGKRALFPELPTAKEVHHTEEHLVIETDRANEYSLGDALIALPYHVCPTSALHQSVTVVQGGKVVDTWTVDARDRKLTI